jgi:hypothetical protein
MFRNIMTVALFACLTLGTAATGAEPRVVPGGRPPSTPKTPPQVRPDQDRYGFRFDRGAWITYVHPGGPADYAGLEPGDIIVSVNGQRITSRQHLQDALARGWGRAELAVIDGRTYVRTHVTAFPERGLLGIAYEIRDWSPYPDDPMPVPFPRPHPWNTRPGPVPNPNPYDPMPGPIPGSATPGMFGNGGVFSPAR